MRKSWIWAVAALLVTPPALGEAGGMSGQPPALFSVPVQDKPIARSASRMFPHDHPLHICGDPDGGWNWLEGHATRDGVVVIHHDATLRRMAGDHRAIADLDWAELARVRTLGGAQVPQLNELLSSFPDLFVNIEPKSERVLAPLADLLRGADAVSRVGIGCFNPRRTQRMCALLGGDVAWSPAHAGVFRLWLSGWGLAAGRLNFPMVQVPTHFQGIPVVTPRFVAAAHARGIQVHVWTVDEEAEMERLLDMGVDALMTDRPSLLRAVLERRGQWHGG